MDQNTHIQILHTSAELFLTLGFKSVTMDEIASAMGMSKKTIYTYYPNKSKLVHASVMHLFNHIVCGINEICASNDDPIAELYEVKQYVSENLRGEKTSPQFQLKKYYPEVHAELLTKQYDHMEECIKDNLDRGLKDGLYRENIDIEFITRIYFIGITGIKEQNMFPTADFDLNEVLDQYLEYHLRGIVTPAGRKQLNLFIQSKNN